SCLGGRSCLEVLRDVDAANTPSQRRVIEMKQCPQCNEVFDDQKAFCDMDGAALIDQTEFIRQALHRANPPSSSASNWVTGVIGGLIGVIVCVLLYIAFLGPNSNDAKDRDQRSTQTKDPAP